MPTLNIGLNDDERQGVIQLLNRGLANSYLLVIKTKKYHWDVVGPQFMTLHKLWEGHYEALTLNIDAYAERIRALGGYPAGTAKEFLELATLDEHPGDLPNPTQMVGRLIVDHESIIRDLRRSIDQCSNDFHDEGTADFLTGLMAAHEKMAWMLRSFIEGEAVNPVTSSESLKIPAAV